MIEKCFIISKEKNKKEMENFKMKKFLIVMIIALVAVGSIFAADVAKTENTSKVTLGVSAGVDDKVAQIFGRGEYFKGVASEYGFTLDVRGDYKVTDKLSVTGIFSWDVLTGRSFKARVDHFAHYADVPVKNETTHYLGLFAGVSYDLFKIGPVTINGSIGPEFDLNLSTGKFDGLVAAGLKASYPVSEKVDVDLTFRGGVAYLVDGDFVKRSAEADTIYTNNKVTLGATYKF